MSVLSYLATDIPLPKVESPHERLLSINQALELGLELSPDWLAPELDRDLPGQILYCDRQVHIHSDGRVEDGDLDDDFAICPISRSGEDLYTEKTYCAALNWRYTPGRARRVISYIRQLLEQTDEVELWQIWQGGDKPPKRKSCTIPAAELTAADLEELMSCPVWQEPTVQYRYVIKK